MERLSNEFFGMEESWAARAKHFFMRFFGLILSVVSIVVTLVLLLEGHGETTIIEAIIPIEPGPSGNKVQTMSIGIRKGRVGKDKKKISHLRNQLKEARKEMSNYLAAANEAIKTFNDKVFSIEMELENL